MTLPTAIAGLVAFLGYAAGAFGWERSRRGDAVSDRTFATYQRLQTIGPIVGTLAAGVAAALHAAGPP